MRLPFIIASLSASYIAFISKFYCVRIFQLLAVNFQYLPCIYVLTQIFGFCISFIAVSYIAIVAR